MSDNQMSHGFSQAGGVDWSKYIQYRPIYPESFRERILEYHKRKPHARWLTAHDVGAGAGIVSGALLEHFQHVVVSDPNEDYLSLARDLLTQGQDRSKDVFTFWQKPAEDCKEVGSGSVDLITACECIQYTDAEVALEEFHRQLKVGGSLLVSFYARPVLCERAANKDWDRIFTALIERLGDDYRVKRSVSIVNSGLATLEFPEDQWEDVKRVYINTHGSHDVFKMTDLVGEDKTRPGEEIEWINDEDWVDHQSVDWLKAYVATWVPTISEDDARDIWTDIEGEVGKGKTRLETPVAIILATKKGVSHS